MDPSLFKAFESQGRWTASVHALFLGHSVVLGPTGRCSQHVIRILQHMLNIWLKKCMVHCRIHGLVSIYHNISHDDLEQIAVLWLFLPPVDDYIRPSLQ